MKETAKAEYCTNLFDEVKAAAAYWRQCIVPCISQEHEHSVEGCKPPDQWKIARVSAPFEKGREEDRTCYRTSYA